jgi:hypothetical protein
VGVPRGALSAGRHAGQGDEERSRGMQVSPNCDRDAKTRVEIQRGFSDHLVRPFFETCAALYPSTFGPWVRQIRKNRAFFEVCALRPRLTSRLTPRREASK